MNRLAGVLLLTALLSSGCGKAEEEAGDSDPTTKLPAKYKSLEEVRRPEFGEAANSPAFRQAIADAGALLGSEPKPLEPHPDVEGVKGGVSFEVPPKKLESLIRKAHADFLRRGFYLFRCENNYGIGGAPDKVGLLPTRDKYDVIAAMETNGVNYDIGTAGIIAWLKDLEAEQPFMLTGIGFDHLEGHFTTTIKDRKALARRMYEFCPDIVQQGVGSLSKLADELRNGTLYFWWD